MHDPGQPQSDLADDERSFRGGRIILRISRWAGSFDQDLSEACFQPSPTLCRSNPGDSRDMSCTKAPVKVFLADDSVLIRDRVVAMLEGGAIDIVGQAHTPQGSIDGILAAQPDVVVLDVQLEGGFGLEVLRAVRLVAPDIVFVVFSNNASPAYRKRYAREGAEDFLDKSTEFDQLARAIVNAAQQSMY